MEEEVKQAMRDAVQQAFLGMIRDFCYHSIVRFKEIDNFEDAMRQKLSEAVMARDVAVGAIEKIFEERKQTCRGHRLTL